MNKEKRAPAFRRWAITAVIAPFVAILVLRFGIGPLLWPDSARMLGDVLGKVFLLYLMVLAIVATILKVKAEHI
jgi:hypothetical protein